MAYRAAAAATSSSAVARGSSFKGLPVQRTALHARGRPGLPRGRFQAVAQAGPSGQYDAVKNHEVNSLRMGDGIDVQYEPQDLVQQLGAGELPDDMIQYFRDAQQNILELNRNRLLAVQELQREKKLNETLAARVKQMDGDRAEFEQQLHELERRVQSYQAQQLVLLTVHFDPCAQQLSVPELPADRVGVATGAAPGQAIPPGVWSSLHLQIDSLCMDGLLQWEEAQELRVKAWQQDRIVGQMYAEVAGSERSVIAGQLRAALQKLKKPVFRVVQICTELAPVACQGALADSITGLSQALQRKGHQVEIIMPKYDTLDESQIEDFHPMEFKLFSFYQGDWHQNRVWTGVVGGLPVFFIEPLHPAAFFSRGQLYGCEDDFDRFAYFSRAALELLSKLGRREDIIHIHNWQTALVAPLYWDVYAPAGMDHSRIVFTCHDFRYQLSVPADQLSAVGLDPGRLCQPDRLQDNHFHDRVNLVKGGIVFSNKITTLSAMIVNESLTSEGGHGLHTTLNDHRQVLQKFVGVLNGLDENKWNPATDTSLPANYSVEDLAGKARCKAVVQERMGLLVDPDIPLVVCVSRALTEEHFDLLRAAMERVSRHGAQIVVMGSSRQPKVQVALEELARGYQPEDGVRMIARYDEATARLLTAGGDIALALPVPDTSNQSQARPHPSMRTSDPATLIAMRYGTVPVARQVSGWNDSVFDVDDPNLGAHDTNGFVYYGTDANSMGSSLERALNRMREKKSGWRDLVVRAMLMDFSWEANASDNYADIYATLRQ
eukprot:jgi/Chlat1/5364/Chrsp35S05211